MSYTRTTWIARVGTALNRFLKTNEDSPSGTVELTNDPTGVTTAGTPFTVANMNKIEDGIYDAHYPTFTEAVTLENIATGEVGTTLWGKVKKAIATIILWLDQGVKTTDSPTFVDVHATVNGAQFYTGGAKKALVFGTGNDFYTNDYWYELLLPYFPTVGDKVFANGWLKDTSGNTLHVEYVWRDTSIIKAAGVNSSFSGPLTIGFISDNTSVSVNGIIVL